MDERIVIVISTMKNRINQNLTLDELALSVFLSRWRFSHLFKHEVGVPPAHYLKSLKMLEAKRLLKSSPLSIKQIIFQLGIKDKSHFERDFKKKYGLTPAQYRVASLRKRQYENTGTIPAIK
jgi:AraC family transcriptional regulator of arabinose operon